MTRGKKTRCNNTWTEARYFTFIRSALRRASYRYPAINQAKKLASRPSQLSDKRTKWQYQCAKCRKWYKGKGVNVHHIKEIGTLKKYSDLPRFVKRLFCEPKDLIILCLKCHDKEHGK